jgi:hypothetical protein
MWGDYQKFRFMGSYYQGVNSTNVEKVLHFNLLLYINLHTFGFVRWGGLIFIRAYFPDGIIFLTPCS